MKTTKTMTDAMGNQVPVNYVKKEDKIRDRNVRRVLARFQKARKMLEQTVADCLEDLDEIVKARGSVAEKGNISCRSFDGLVEVNVRQTYEITLDDSVIRAREMMIDYVGRMLREMGNRAYVVQKLVEAAFKTDAKGFLSRSKIHELVTLQVADPDWNRAVRILLDAMKRQKGKRYLSCRVRPDTQHDFSPILLDIATCWPEVAVPPATTAENADE